MEILELIGKIVGGIFVFSVFIKAWSNDHKGRAMLTLFLGFPAILYCITHWYEMKNYFLIFVGTTILLIVTTLGLSSFGIIEIV